MTSHSDLHSDADFGCHLALLWLPFDCLQAPILINKTSEIYSKKGHPQRV